MSVFVDSHSPILSSFKGTLYNTSFLLLSDTVMNANSFLSLSDFLTGRSSFVSKKEASGWFIWGLDMCECNWMWLSGCVEKVGTGACAFSVSWMKQEWKKLNEQQLGERSDTYGLKKCVLITLWTLSHGAKSHFLFIYFLSKSCFHILSIQQGFMS